MLDHFHSMVGTQNGQVGLIIKLGYYTVELTMTMNKLWLTWAIHEFPVVSKVNVQIRLDQIE